jgi:tryptophan synthase alpha chain
LFSGQLLDESLVYAWLAEEWRARVWQPIGYATGFCIEVGDKTLSRIASTFERLRQQQKKAVIPYLVAGDPAPDFTCDALHALVSAGADILELGVPFSDPMAEGPVIQLAHERALLHGVSLRRVLQMVATFRQRDDITPLVLMGYANPVEVMGYDNFAVAAAEAGVDGLLTVDMPPEEGGELAGALSAQGIDSILLLAPTTTEQRARYICQHAAGYVYYVSLKGVTGAGHLDTGDVGDRLSMIKQYTDLPVTVGFGIKDAVSASAVATHCDGVVIGSALVNAVAEAAATGATSSGALVQPALSLVQSIRSALDSV